MTHESLARRLRVLRAARGITLAEAEELTGVTRETLGALEHGQRGAYTSTLEKIARGYGVTASALLEEEPIPLVGAPSEPGQAATPGVGNEPEHGPKPTLQHDYEGTLRRRADAEELKKRASEIEAEERTPELLLEQLHEHGIRTNLSEASILGQIIGMSDELVEEDPVDHERIGWLLAAAALSGLLTQDERRVALQTAREWLAGEQTPAGY